MNYRYNIDPSNTLTDDKLWAALDIVQMKEVIMALPHQLGNVLFVDLFIAFCKQMQQNPSG
jgi:ABC-type multidrug transport system fused ATPase/permease subunit